MANPRIPAGMCPTVANYSTTGPGGVWRTELDGGPSRYALQYDRGVQQFSVTLILKPDAYQAWTLFYLHIIKKGSLTFDMPLDSGQGSELHACNIVPGSYSTTRTGGWLTVVSFVVEAEASAYQMSAADAQAIIDFYNAGGGVESSKLLERIAQFANRDSNVLDF